MENVKFFNKILYIITYDYEKEDLESRFEHHKEFFPIFEDKILEIFPQLINIQIQIGDWTSRSIINGGFYFVLVLGEKLNKEVIQEKMEFLDSYLESCGEVISNDFQCTL